MKKIIIINLFLLLSLLIKAQTTNDLLNLLVGNYIITAEQADSVRAEAAIKQREADEKKKSFNVTSGKLIQMSGYTQARCQILEEKGKNDGFDIRRARINLKGTITPYWAYRVQFELATTPKLLDAYAEFKLNDYLNLTIGQAQVPFSLENLTSSGKLEMIDRSQSVEALTARGKDIVGNQSGRDIGIQLGGAILKLKDRTFLDYRIGLFNGSGINTTDKNETKDVGARLGLFPVAGLSICGSYYDGQVNIGDTINYGRGRYGFDLSYDLKNLAVRGEFIHGKDSKKDKEGYYVQAGYYFLQKKLQVLAKYDTYDPDKSKENDGSAWYVFGVNYNFNTNTRLQANYTIKQEEGTSVDNNYTSIQLQIGF